MKLLIIDDEKHVIQAIRLLVPWEELGIDQIFTAASGTEALITIAREQPEIVITDILMEDMSGIDIMNVIASRYPTTKVIAVSGHNDFEYVRAMLTKGCMDYLLKPLESTPLIDTVRKVVDSWKAEHESSRQNQHLLEKIHSLSAFYAETQLYKILKAGEWSGAYQKLLQLDARFASISVCKILYYNTGFFPMRKSAFLTLLKSFEEQLRQLLQSGKPPALRMEGTGGILLSNPEQSGEVILFLYESAESLTSSIFKLAQSIFGDQSYPFHIGSSKKKAFPDEFSEAFSQAQYAFFSVYGDRDCSAIAIAGFSGNPALTLPSDKLRQLENQIYSALLSGHIKDLEAAVFSWINNILPDKDITLFQIQHAMNLFNELFKQWLIKIKKQNPTFAYETPEHLLVYEDFLDELFRFSKYLFRHKILMLLSGPGRALKENQSAADVMLQIAQYMEINYAKPFVQSEYAKRFCLNKDYMSRKFTTTFGVNMLTYLHHIRISQARELLGNTSLKIHDIALAVGFGDEKYFARQFKKLTGSSPSDYRATRQHKKQES